MRYLIIDLKPQDDKNIEWIDSTYCSAFKGEILSEQETLAKFKEVWEKGSESGYAGNNWDEVIQEL